MTDGSEQTVESGGSLLSTMFWTAVIGVAALVGYNNRDDIKAKVGEWIDYFVGDSSSQESEAAAPTEPAASAAQAEGQAAKAAVEGAAAAADDINKGEIVAASDASPEEVSPNTPQNATPAPQHER